MAQSYRRRCDLLRAQLEQERTTWIPHWQECADYLAPWRGKYLTSTTAERNDGRKRGGKIVDNWGRYALRTLKSGMASGITNQTQPWLRLTTEDPELVEFGPVKDYLHTVETGMYDVLRKSGIYQTLDTNYLDIGVFGTGAMAIEEDMETTIRGWSLPIGSYAVSANALGLVDTCVQVYPMTVRQIVEKFGLATASKTVRGLWDRGTYESVVEVVHCVHPNQDYNPRSPLARHKRYASVWFEAAQSRESDFLRESGFARFPILVPRWEAEGADVWGHGPGMDILADVKQLQTMVKAKGKAVAKMNDPPLAGAPELRSSTVSTVPGGITYTTFRDGRPALAPIYQIQAPVQELREDIKDIQRSISRGAFEDVFLMFAGIDRAQITAREVAERHAEKLAMLGPVLGRLDVDLLNPLVDIVFDAMVKRGDLPPAPEELRGAKLRVEFINVLAQAQRMQGISGIEAMFDFVSRGAQIYGPEALDKFDIDQASDEVGDKYGVSPRILRSDEKVAEIRAKRSREQQAQQSVLAAREVAATAKDLSQADTSGENALTELLRVGSPTR